MTMIGGANDLVAFRKCASQHSHIPSSSRVTRAEASKWDDLIERQKWVIDQSDFC
jgi:hypothetical protein